MEKRVVITGIGAITPIGNNVKDSWEGIKNKKCGIDEITLFDASEFKTKLACEVKNFDPLKYFELKQAKRYDRASQFAIVASKEAMVDSGINEDNTDLDNMAVIMGSGIGGITTLQNQCFVYNEKGHSRISPLFIPMSIVNMVAGNVSMELKAKGESITISSACASATHAIGEAYRIIKNGYEEVAVAGGAEAPICDVSIAGFENMKALSHATDKNRASIPFDKERSGFVMGEGSGMLILEELEHAQKRNAKIYAEIIGYGASSDAYHITSPDPTGNGGARAMERALKDAKLSPNEIDYINAHGTSTSLNDSTETLAIKTVFGKDADNVMVSSTKGNTGHLLGAAGGVEAVLCVKALQDGIIPPTINYKVKDEECDLNLVTNEIKNANINTAMSNSLGFGGHNATIIFKKYEG